MLHNSSPSLRLVTTNYFGLATHFTLAIFLFWTLKDSKAPWFGYLLSGVILTHTMWTQKRTVVDSKGIFAKYFLRPFSRRRFIPINAITKLQWRSGGYPSPSFARLWMTNHNGDLSRFDMMADPSEWNELVAIVKTNQPNVVVVR